MKNMTLQINSLRFISFISLAVLVLFASCKDDDPKPGNEEELITTVTLNFQKTEGENTIGDVLTFHWKDMDGAGSGVPVIEDIVLEPNSTYALSIQLKNESNPNDVEDITAEVEEEGAAHQFFFTPSSALDIIHAYQDEDSNGNPIGLENIITTGDASEGTLNLTLRHNPIKNANGVMQGDITNAGGDTDVAVSFNVLIAE